jgi:hypothetical protein
MIHLCHFVEQIGFIIMAEPFPNTSDIHQAIANENHKQDNKKISDVYVEHRHYSYYRHGAVNENPDEGIGIVHLKKGEKQEHDGKEKIQNLHWATSVIKLLLKIDLINGHILKKLLIVGGPHIRRKKKCRTMTARHQL